VTLNPRHLEAQLALAALAIDQGDRRLASSIRDQIGHLSAEDAAVLSERIEKMAATTVN